MDLKFSARRVNFLPLIGDSGLLLTTTARGYSNNRSRLVHSHCRIKQQNSLPVLVSTAVSRKHNEKAIAIFSILLNEMEIEGPRVDNKSSDRML